MSLTSTQLTKLKTSCYNMYQHSKAQGDVDRVFFISTCKEIISMLDIRQKCQTTLNLPVVKLQTIVPVSKLIKSSKKLRRASSRS